MGLDLLDMLISDAVRELRAVPASGLASQVAMLAIVIMGLGEAAWLAGHRTASARSRLLADTGTAALLGMGGLLVGVALAGLFMVEFELVGRAGPGFAARFWIEHKVIGFAAAFVAWDLVGYLYHRIGHATGVGWAAHRPHHTGDHFTMSLAWRQSWLPVHAVVLPLVALGGWSLSTIVICAALSNVMQAMQHTSAQLRLPRWVIAVVMTPQQHRRHHHCRTDGDDAGAATAVNLGPIFTIWDRLAGSYDETPVDAGALYGVGSTTRNPFRIQVEGWSDLAKRRCRLRPMAGSAEGAPAYDEEATFKLS